MKVPFAVRTVIWIFPAALLLGACSTDPGLTISNQPGPAVGRAVGAGVGAVTGNAAGAVVGVGEGFTQGFAKPFDPTTRVIRRWRTETTPDGRTIQVPEEIVVDAEGRPVKPVAPKK